jgi:hypothetical protein
MDADAPATDGAPRTAPCEPGACSPWRTVPSPLPGLPLRARAYEPAQSRRVPAHIGSTPGMQSPGYSGPGLPRPDPPTPLTPSNFVWNKGAESPGPRSVSRLPCRGRARPQAPAYPGNASALASGTGYRGCRTSASMCSTVIGIVRLLLTFLLLSAHTEYHTAALLLSSDSDMILA